MKQKVENEKHVENYVGMVKKRIEKVIFNTADWVSEPKKIDFAKYDFDEVDPYLNRFLKAWAVGLPIAITAALLVGPIAKKFVDKITK